MPLSKQWMRTIVLKEVKADLNNFSQTGMLCLFRGREIMLRAFQERPIC